MRPAEVDRRLGRTLGVLRDRQVHLELGWIRLGDYTAECLGLSLRTVQDLIRTETILAALPLTAASFEAGQLSAAHVRALGRIAIVETEKTWIVRARRMDVRSLRRAVAAALAREEAAGAPGAASGGDGGDTGPFREDGSAGPDGGRATAAAPLGEDKEDDGPELKRLTVSAPAWVISWWRDAVTLARRLAGRALPRGAALETVLAESQDVIGSGADSLGRPGADLSAAGSAPRETTDAQGTISREVPHAAEGARGAVSVGQGPDGNNRPAKAQPVVPSACGLDAELRWLVTERQRVESALAERLGMDRAAGAHLLDGGGSFERYASRRYGISPRQVYYLLSLQRTLERLSALNRAYASGRLTRRQTILVGKVATRRTALAWIRRAERITLRRLEDEVEYWELLRVERPEVWERLKGYPLPDGIVLVPGHAPRLHAFARRGAAGGIGSSESHHATSAGRFTPPEKDHEGDNKTLPDLHTFARPGAAGDNGCSDSATQEGVESGFTRTDLDAFASRSGAGAAPGSVLNDATGDLHAFARPEPRVGSLADTGDDLPIEAWSFIEALGASVAATPLPARMGVLRMRVEPETLAMWRDTVAHFRALSDEPLEEWEVLVLVLRRFFQVWDNKETRRQRREHPILERDGWRCAFPGCRSMGTGRLQTHHILFRSHGGTDDDPGLLVALCNAHHQHLLHQGFIRCSGRAPDDLVWELGTGGNLPAWRIYRGDVLVGGRAFVLLGSTMGVPGCA